MQALHEHIGKDGFRLRGTAMSRVDGFSDVVFGFALTLLVVSLEVPRTYDELHNVLLGFVPFAICFFLFMSIWWGHFKFFRRFGLHDAGTVWINAALLFTVLLYVYPLKFLFTVATGNIAPGVFSNPYQLRELMTVYGAGFAAINLCFAALYANAWRQRLHLRLNPVETAITVSAIWRYLGVASFGLLCCVMAFVLPLNQAGRASYSFLLILVFTRIHKIFAQRRLHTARARRAPEDNAALHHG
jgi:uncharacterized membrane protein